MILSFPEVRKAPTDVKNVALDWTPLLECTAPVSIVTHSAWTETADLETDLGDGVPAGEAGVVTVDVSVSGLVQTVQISAGEPDAYSLISAQATFSDGTSLTRSFMVIVR